MRATQLDMAGLMCDNPAAQRIECCGRNTVRIGVDIGGTFTDFVIVDDADGRVESFKRLSTPHDPALAVLEGVAGLPADGRRFIVHGSTVATNAVLERKGARTALVTTRGFRDVLSIGRQDRPALYDFFADPPDPLVPEHLRLEVDERVTASGHVLRAPSPEEVERLVRRLSAEGVESVAVVFLFSFLHPDHEQAVGEHLRRAGFAVSLSSEVLPEYREYERTSTTVINAYVAPVLDRYLARLEAGLRADELRIMQSNGGSISADEARRHAVRCVLSGPAGGVVGAFHVARLAGHERLITFDMGGTSTDVSLCDGAVRVTTEATVGGHPIRVPVVDIHTVGAGGGSVASVDAGGALRVGPESAGADPGPACYGRGGEAPTVTDANLVLGRLLPDHFLGGAMPLDESRAWEALETLGRQAGLPPPEAALGVVHVTNAHMERALRLISVERGHDPADFTLVSFGGAGGLHAADLARRLGIPLVLVPRHAATLSALGMVVADVVRDAVRTVMVPATVGTEALEPHFAALVARGVEDVRREGVPPDRIVVERALDMRYRGQSYELTVPLGPNPVAAFHRAHEHLYGYADPRAPVEIVNVRVRVTGRLPTPHLPAEPVGDPDPSDALLEERDVAFAEGVERVPVYLDARLRPGHVIAGPALVVRQDTTLLVGPHDRAEVDTYHNLLIHVGQRG